MTKNLFSRRLAACTTIIAFIASGALANGDPPADKPLALSALVHHDPSAPSGQARQIDLGSGLDLPKPPSAQKLEITYDVYVGGLHLATAALAATVDHGHYLAVSTVSTKGLADSFASSQIAAVSTGDVRDHLVVPHTYNSDTTAPDKRQLVGLLYDHDGLPTDINSNPAYDLNRFPVLTDQKRGTVDPLSAALYIMLGSSVSDGHKCGAVVPVFDGKRRYNLTFDYKKDDTASLGKAYNNGRSVPAYLCTTNYVRVAGFKPSKKGKGYQVPTLDIWMAPYPGTDFILPVRMQTSTEFGGIVARATKLVVTLGG
ncbi:MAG: DUF3108 domain-containing protein [Alphaproteobacteria bacterium]